MPKTAVAAEPYDSSLYVFQLEETIRELDRIICAEMPPIRADRPTDHGLEGWIATLVESLRDGREAS